VISQPQPAPPRRAPASTMDGVIDRERDSGAKVIDVGAVDLEELAEALADQADYERCWLIDPAGGQIVL